MDFPSNLGSDDSEKTGSNKPDVSEKTGSSDVSDSDDNSSAERGLVTEPAQVKVPTRPARVHGHRENEASGSLLPFWWDMQKLHALNIAVTRLDIDELRWHLTWKVWSNYGAPFQISPSEVRKDPLRFSIHYERTMNAELSFPLYVIYWEDRWTILDGIHRLLKADILGEKSVPVCVVSDQDLPKIIVASPESSNVADEPGKPTPT